MSVMTIITVSPRFFAAEWYRIGKALFSRDGEWKIRTLEKENVEYLLPDTSDSDDQLTLL